MLNERYKLKRKEIPFHLFILLIYELYNKRNKGPNSIAKITYVFLCLRKSKFVQTIFDIMKLLVLLNKINMFEHTRVTKIQNLILHLENAFTIKFYLYLKTERELWCNFRHSARTKYFYILVATLKVLPKVVKIKLALFVVVVVT